MNYIKQQGDTLFVLLPEEIDHHQTPKLASEIDEVLLNGTANKLVFDFIRTKFMDSSGIGLLMGRYRKMQSLGGQVLVQNVTDHLNKILQLSGVQKYIRKYEETK